MSPLNVADEEYKGLLADHLQATDEERDVRPHTKHVLQRPQSVIVLITCASVAANILLVGVMVFVRLRSFQTPLSVHPHAPANLIYSPADAVAEYEVVEFATGLPGEFNPYVGDSDAVDRAWLDMYDDIGITTISEEEQSALPNKTARTSYDDGRYVVELEVFHQLHCLNMLRKFIYPSKYAMHTDPDGPMHGEHCAETLRQALQCQSDTATLYWEWSESHQSMRANLATLHVCKRFDKVQEWARQHPIQTNDWKIKTKDAPVMRKKQSTA